MALTVKPLPASPEFDIFFYADVSGDSRMDQDLFEKFEARWDDWAKLVKAFELKEEDRQDKSGFVVIYLPQEVEDEIEEIWQRSPTDGLAFNNLAVTMVMTTASGLIPELADGGCAPLPEPDARLIKALNEAGLKWNEEGSVNRKYAVLSFMPYKGGCPICYLQEKCPNSSVKGK